MLLDGFDKIRCVDQRFMRPCVKPGESLPEQFYIQLSLFQVDPVQIRDLKFPAGGGLQVFRIFNYTVIVEI